MFKPRKARVRSTDRDHGFTLIECMVVLAIIGILLGLLAPSLSRVMVRARMTDACANVREAGMAWCRSNLGSSNPQMGPGVVQPSEIDMADFSYTLSASEILELERHLDSVLPKVDTWGNPIEYLTNGGIPPFPLIPPDQMPTQFMVRAANTNGAFEPPYYWQTTFPVTNPVADIVWANCDWVQMPGERD